MALMTCLYIHLPIETLVNDDVTLEVDAEALNMYLFDNKHEKDVTLSSHYGYIRNAAQVD